MEPRRTGRGRRRSPSALLRGHDPFPDALRDVPLVLQRDVPIDVPATLLATFRRYRRPSLRNVFLGFAGTGTVGSRQVSVVGQTSSLLMMFGLPSPGCCWPVSLGCRDRWRGCGPQRWGPTDWHPGNRAGSHERELREHKYPINRPYQIFMTALFRRLALCQPRPLRTSGSASAAAWPVPGNCPVFPS